VVTGTAAVGFFEGDVWHQYGITDIREIFGEPARFAGTAHSTDPIFAGQQIFMRVDAGFTGGLYTSSHADWIFPEPFAVPPGNVTSVNTSQIDSAVYGFFNDSHLVLVPEPPPLCLVLVGAALLVLFGYGRQQMPCHYKRNKNL
jgi:hypothetical protein